MHTYRTVMWISRTLTLVNYQKIRAAAICVPYSAAFPNFGILIYIVFRYKRTSDLIMFYLRRHHFLYLFVKFTGQYGILHISGTSSSSIALWWRCRAETILTYLSVIFFVVDSHESPLTVRKFFPCGKRGPGASFPGWTAGTSTSIRKDRRIIYDSIPSLMVDHPAHHYQGGTISQAMLFILAQVSTEAVNTY